jgi:hypothetical protein
MFCVPRSDFRLLFCPVDGTVFVQIDAAARILDPILAPLVDAESRTDRTCSPPYGCFLKDFFVTEW